MRRELGMLVALVVLCGGLYLNNHAFLSASNISNTARQAAMLGILGVGVAFVIIQGGIDLSIGSLVGLTGVVIAKLTSREISGGWDWPLWAGICTAVGVALAVGLLQGLLITRLKLQPFIVTLGGMLLLKGLAQVIVEGGTISVTSDALKTFGKAGLLYVPVESVVAKIPGNASTIVWHWAQATLFAPASLAPNTQAAPLLPWPALLLFVVVVIAVYALHFTVFGRYLFAIGGNRDAAIYSGLPVFRCELSTYVLSSLCAALAGICYCGYIGQMNQGVGVAYELYAIAGCVLGGISLRGGEGSILGVLIGTTILRVIENGINLVKYAYEDIAGVAREWRLSSNYQFVVIGAVILIAVILDQVVHELSERRKRRAPTAAPAAG